MKFPAIGLPLLWVWQGEKGLALSQILFLVSSQTHLRCEALHLSGFHFEELFGLEVHTEQDCLGANSTSSLY